MRTRESRWSGAVTLCLVGSLAGMVVGCGEPPEEEPPAAPGVRDSATALRGALPGLFGIMLGLQEDMRRLDRGLWIESYDTVAAAARAVADHPTVPPEEFQRISSVLGDEMASFREMDRNVHDLAVEIEGHAQGGRLDGVLATGAELRRGCVDCHTAYRARLREGLAGDGRGDGAREAGS